MRINLLPQAERNDNGVINRIMLAVVLVSFVLYLGIYAFNLYMVYDLERQVAEQSTKRELLRPTQEKMSVAKNIESTIGAKNNLLATLTKGRKSWYTIFAHFSNVTLPEVWLTDADASNRQAMNVKGMAMDYPGIAKFIQKMEQDDIFAEPVLVNAQRDTASTATKFEIMVKLKGL